MSEIIGLTGPTGSGKSTVCLELKRRGAYIIDCDELARKAVEIPSCIESLKASFGDDIVENGMLIRRRLAEKAFVSDENTRLLNELTHPYIIELLKEEVSKNGEKTIVIDAPLLFEAELDKLCDHTVTVFAPVDIRLQRIINRDNISREEAVLRMARQHGDDYYIDRADVVLNGNSDDINKEISRILEILQVVI